MKKRLTHGKLVQAGASNVTERKMVARSPIAVVATCLCFLLLTKSAQADLDIFPLFRMTSTDTERLLTTSCTERKYVSSTGNWFDEGIIGYLPSTQLPNTVKLYRFVHSGSQHFYTTDQNEGLRVGMKEEVINAYIYLQPQPGLLPVYRLMKGVEHFYTNSLEEAKIAERAGYNIEAILGYVIDLLLDPCPVPKIVQRPGFGGFDWGKPLADAAKAFRDNTGPAWEHVKTSIGPDINRGFLHFAAEAGKFIVSVFYSECSGDCKIHVQTTNNPPPNYNPSSLVRGTAPCKGPGDTIYPAGSITYFYGMNNDEYVCNGYDNGLDPGYASWTFTGRHRTGV